MKKTLILSIATLLLVAGAASAATIARTGGPVYLYQWYSTNPSVAGVNPQTGLITPVWYGTTDVCVQLKTDLAVKLCNTVTIN